MTTIKARARGAAGVVKRRAQERLRTGGRLERRLYYGLFSDGFRREEAAVARGHAVYKEKLRTNQQRFLIRRNTHMLEKGLIMRPRRGTFAIAYIEETISAFASCLAAEPPLVSDEEVEWIVDVLDQYFDATADSEAREVVKARKAYAATSAERSSRAFGRSGPQPAPVDEPPVEIDALLALAERRKSVRWFAPTKVPREVIDKAMLVGAESPSACNRQPFQFRIFDDPELVEQVSAVPMGTSGYAHNIPCIAVIVGDFSAFYDERDRHLIYIDGCLAAMGFILGLEAQGVATCCINWPDIAAREQRMEALLGLGTHERPVMLIAIGYPDPEGKVPFSARRPLDDLRSYNQR